MVLAGCGYDVSLGSDDGGTCGPLAAGFGVDPAWNGCAPLVIDVAQVDNAGLGTNGLAVDGQGRVLLAGSTKDTSGAKLLLVMRLLENGQRDSTFGRQGVTAVWYTSVNTGHSVAVQGSSVFLGGSAMSLGNEPIAVVAKLDDVGVLDPNYGSNGVEKISVPLGTFGECFGVLPRSNGSVVCSGSYWPLFPGAGDGRVAQLTPAGPLDSSFGTNGSARIDVDRADDHAGAAVSLAGGELLLPMTGTVGGQTDSVVAKFSARGVLDPSFGDGGIARVDVGGNDGCEALTVLSDGSAVCAGFSTVAGQRVGALVKFTTSGAPDMSFGAGGVLSLQGFSTVWAVAEVSANEWLVAGDAVVAGADTALAFQSVSPQGNISRGVATVNVTPTEDSVRSLVRDGDGSGRWWASGVAGKGSGNDDLVVLRLIHEADRANRAAVGCSSAGGVPLLLAVLLLITRRHG